MVHHQQAKYYIVLLYVLYAGEPFRNQVGMEHAIFIPGAGTDHAVTVLHFAGIMSLTFLLPCS